MRLRNVFLIAMLLFLGGMVSAQNWVTITSDSPVPIATQLVSNDASATVVEFNLGGFFLNPVNTSRGEAFVVDVEGATSLLEKGNPDLPKLTASVIIPDQAQMEVRVVSSRYIDYPFIEIAPSKGNFTRDIDPSTVPYVYGRTYDRDEFFPSAQASLRDPYILRDYRGQTIIANPFSYNPVTKILRVYYQMTVEIYENGISNYNVLNHQLQSEAVDSEYQRIYERHFLNAGNGSRYTPLEEQGNMLIISHGAFMPDMEEFVAWKKTIGIPTEMVDVATIGVNAAAIKTFVADYYANQGLTYLLLVGDNAQIPTVTTGSLGGPSDHAYGYIVGNDHYPDIFVGRFSAETNAHVQTQVARTITYEQNPDVSVDWFSLGLGIASSEGTGDDGEYDWQHMRNLRAQMLDYTYTAVSELYDGSQGGNDAPGNPNSGHVTAELNEGRSIINYTGHGSQTSWSSSGFSNTGVNGLSNNGKWPFIWSVACVNGDFQNGTCFAEAWLRATNIDGPTGALATLMSTINQTWNPPMEGQDEMVAILVESYENNIKRTFGGISMNGCMQMNDAYGSGGANMTDTWLCFGDPSVMVRTAFPEELTVTHEPVAFIGSDQYIINCTVENAFACLTIDGEIIGSAYISGGAASISFPTLNDVGTMKLAVTAFNHVPYIADIDIFPLDGPYVIYNSQLINDETGNNNQQVDYGESVLMTLAFKNVGTEAIENVEVTLSSANPSIFLSDTTEVYPIIGAGEIESVTDGFAFSIGNDLPDGTAVILNYVAVSGEQQWTGSFSVITHSVKLEFAGNTISDESGNNNGKADPGETFDLNIALSNAGSAAAYNVTALLFCDDPNILLSVDSLNYGMINGNETLTSAFTATAHPATPSGYVAQFELQIYADSGFVASGSFSIVIGQIPVLIIDLDKNHNSAPAIQSCLSNISVASDLVTEWPGVLGTYQSVFVCLGIYPNNTVLSSAQGQSLANFLSLNGGKIYMEGGDTWAYNTATAVHPMFMINGLTDGSGDLQTLNGIESTMTDGMAFVFQGDNSYIDRLSPIGEAVSIFKNSSPVYDATISFDGGAYKTIGSSFEFGGLVDNDSRSVKDTLMMEYINFFGLSTAAPLFANFIASDVQVCENEAITFTDFSAGDILSWAWSFPGGVPDTSDEQNPVVFYAEPGVYDVTLTVSDGVNTHTSAKDGYITVDYCMGVNDVPARAEVLVYPNPGNGNFTIELPEFTGETSLRVIAATGKEVYRTETGQPGIQSLNLPESSSGVYILLIDNVQFSRRIKLVVGH
ncbi:MAG: T9SS type A sorting domain-containing protein [Lentimicrobium sp.]|nr:T9SS type A sorting domain-containing protein [Lentimicrobium sp.]